MSETEKDSFEIVCPKCERVSEWGTRFCPECSYPLHEIQLRKEKIAKLFEAFKDPFITSENRKLILKEINELQKRLDK